MSQGRKSERLSTAKDQLSHSYQLFVKSDKFCEYWKVSSQHQIPAGTYIGSPRHTPLLPHQQDQVTDLILLYSTTPFIHVSIGTKC